MPNHNELPKIGDLHAEFPGILFAKGTDEFTAGATVSLGAGAPKIVAKPTTATDLGKLVARCVAIGATIAVRAGGHGSQPATADVLIDLRAFSAVTVLPGNLVTVGGGAVWGQVADSLAKHGLLITSGDTREVGVGGLAQVGGIGWLVRQYGLTVDLIRSVELVTADGEVRRVSAESEPELFWAVRGGSGNFGIVTEFVMQASPVSELSRATVSFPISSAKQVLQAWRSAFRATPALNGTVFMRTTPDGGEVALAALLPGGELELRAALSEVLSLPAGRDIIVAPTSYVDMLQSVPLGAPPFKVVTDNGLMPELSDDLIDRIVALLGRSAPTGVFVRTMSGAYGGVPVEATAFGVRDAEVIVVTNGFLPKEASSEAIVEVAAENAAALAGRTGSYGGFMPSSSAAIISRMYPPKTFERLLAVKRTYDPSGVFCPTHAVLQR